MQGLLDTYMSSNIEPKKSVTVLGDTIQAGNSQTYTYELPADATVTDLSIQCYIGQEFDLRYTVQVDKSNQDRTVNLIEDITGTNYVAGNDDEFDFAIRKSLSKGDVVKVTVENTDTNGHEYHTNLRLSLDYGASYISQLRDILAKVM